jgi:hypothetical protein
VQRQSEFFAGDFDGLQSGCRCLQHDRAGSRTRSSRKTGSIG